jgi:hypothetical protein
LGAGAPLGRRPRGQFCQKADGIAGQRFVSQLGHSIVDQTKTYFFAVSSESETKMLSVWPHQRCIWTASRHKIRGLAKIGGFFVFGLFAVSWVDHAAKHVTCLFSCWRTG